MRLCPECLINPAPDQRPQAPDGRCAGCQRQLSWARVKRDRDLAWEYGNYAAPLAIE